MHSQQAVQTLLHAPTEVLEGRQTNPVAVQYATGERFVLCQVGRFVLSASDRSGDVLLMND